MSDKPNLDEFHYHEILDRTHVIMSNIDHHLLQHPVAKLDKEICRRIEYGVDSLAEAYQIIAQRTMENFESNEG